MKHDWKTRLTANLEPILISRNPALGISAYHNMPSAIFLYPPEQEWDVRKEISMLISRLEQAGKRVTTISLAICLYEAADRAGLSRGRMAEAEKRTGAEAMVETVHRVISGRFPLDNLVAEQIPDDAEPTRDIVLMTRTGSLFPFYRTSALLEQLAGKVAVPAILFYPGKADGAAGLRFMGVLDADHNYRPKIF